MQIKFKVANIRLLYYPAKGKSNQPKLLNGSLRSIDPKCAIRPRSLKNKRVFLFKGGGVASRIERVPKTRVERHVSASCRTVG